MNRGAYIRKTAAGLAALGAVAVADPCTDRQSGLVASGVSASVQEALEQGSSDGRMESIDRERLKLLVRQLRGDPMIQHDRLLDGVSDEELLILMTRISTVLQNDETLKQYSGNGRSLLEYIYIILVPIIIAALYGYTYSGGIVNILKEHNLANSAFYRNFFFLNGMACIRNGFHLGSLTYFVGTCGALIGWISNEWLKKKIANGEVASGGRSQLVNYLLNCDFSDLEAIIKELGEKRHFTREEEKRIIARFMALQEKVESTPRK